MPRCRSIALSRSSIVSSRVWTALGNSARRGRGGGKAAAIFRVILDLCDHLRAELPQVGAEPAEYLDGHAVILG